MQPSPTLARRFWEAVEPLHALVYFTPEPAEAARAVGVTGWWRGYFAGRIAPLGALGGPAAAALFFAFSPVKTGYALPAAWTEAAPEKVLDARLAAVRSALDRTLPTDRTGLDELVDLLERAVEGCAFEGGHWPPPGPPYPGRPTRSAGSGSPPPCCANTAATAT